MVPQEAVTLISLIYLANGFWSDGRRQHIGSCGSVPRDLTSLGCIQLYSQTMLYAVPTLGPEKGVRNIPSRLQEFLDHSCPIGSLFHNI